MVWRTRRRQPCDKPVAEQSRHREHKQRHTQQGQGRGRKSQCGQSIASVRDGEQEGTSGSGEERTLASWSLGPLSDALLKITISSLRNTSKGAVFALSLLLTINEWIYPQPKSGGGNCTKFADENVSSFQQGILDLHRWTSWGICSTQEACPSTWNKLPSPIVCDHLCRFPNPLALKKSLTLKHCLLVSLSITTHYCTYVHRRQKCLVPKTPEPKG